MKIRYWIIIACTFFAFSIINAGFGAWKDELNVHVSVELAKPEKNVEDVLDIQSDQAVYDESSGIVSPVTNSVPDGESLGEASQNGASSDETANTVQEDASPAPSEDAGVDSETDKTAEPDDKTESESKEDDSAESYSKALNEKPDAKNSSEAETRPESQTESDSVQSEE